MLHFVFNNSTKIATCLLVVRRKVMWYCLNSIKTGADDRQLGFVSKRFVSHLISETETAHKYNNINSQLDATITDFIVNYNQLNMFRVIISPILRSTRLCLQLVVWCTGNAACWLPPADCNYQSDLLLLHLVGCYIIVSMMHGHTNIKPDKYFILLYFLSSSSQVP